MDAPPSPPAGRPEDSPSLSDPSSVGGQLARELQAHAAAAAAAHKAHAIAIQQAAKPKPQWALACIGVAITVFT